MTNKEVIERLLAIKKLGCLTDKDRQALNLALKALKDVERLEEENHQNFVNSQHIISLLVEEIKKSRGAE